MTRGSGGAGPGPIRRVAAVIPAAGQGKRMGGDTAKQFLPLNGKPILAHTLEVFEASSLISDVVLVVAESEVDACRRDIVALYGCSKVTRVVAGGEERQDSVHQGLAALGSGVDLVAVHDAARPLITAEQLDWAVAAALRVGPAIVAVPVKDTVKVVGADGVITVTPDRRTLWAAQTPQIFPYPLLLAAHRRAAAEGFIGTDDASLVERLGETVRILEGWPENIKVTTPEDLLLAERILARRAAGAAGQQAGRV